MTVHELIELLKPFESVDPNMEVRVPEEDGFQDVFGVYEDHYIVYITGVYL